MKNLLRRALAMTLSVSMVTSMIGILPAFADEPTPTEPTISADQIVKTKDGDNAYVTFDPATKLPTDHIDGESHNSATHTAEGATKESRVDVYKTIESTGVKDEFEITLMVETTEAFEDLEINTDAAVVLVIDNSSSMYQIIDDPDNKSAPSMKNGERGTASYGLAVKSKNNDEENPDPDYNVPYTKAEVNTDAYRGTYDGDNLEFYSRGRIPLAEYASNDLRYEVACTKAKEFVTSFVKDANGAKRDVAIVSFSDGGKQVLTWTDATTAAGLTKINNAIEGIYPDAATNIDGGLEKALTLINNKNCPNEYVVLLSDGAANCYTENGTDTFVASSATQAEKDKLAAQAPATATSIKNTGATLYTVAFTKSAPASLSSLATNKCSYTAADEAALGTSFDSIVASIKSLAKAYQVTDPMGDLILFDEDSIKDDSSATYDETNDTLTWDLRNTGTTVGDTTTYTTTYKIKLDTANDAFVAGKDYLANDYTFLSYYWIDEVTNGNNVAHITPGSDVIHTIPFDVPQVEGDYPTIHYNVEYYLQTGTHEEDGSSVIDYGPANDDSYYDEPVKRYDTVTAISKDYEHYTLNDAESENEPTQISTDGQTLKLYYVKDTTSATVKHFFYDVELTNEGLKYHKNDALTDAHNAEPTTEGLFVNALFTGNADTHVTGYPVGHHNTGAELTGENVVDSHDATSSVNITLVDIDETNPNDNTINFYYFSEEVDNNTTYNVNVLYEYYEHTYELVGGEYKPVTIPYYGVGNSATEIGYDTSFEANHGNTGDYADYTYDGPATNTSELNALTIGTGVNPEITLDHVRANDTITIKYEKSVPKEDVVTPADVAIIHKYFLRTEMVDTEGNSLGFKTDVDEGTVPQAGLRTYYVNETLTASDVINHNEETYHLESVSVSNGAIEDDDHSLTVEADEENTITLIYVRDLIEVDTKVQVTHVYDYSYEKVNKDGVIVPASTHNKDEKDKETYPVGHNFLAGLQPINPEDGKSYKAVRVTTNTGSNVSVEAGAVDLNITLEAKPLNKITIYYELDSTLVDDAQAFVDHTYYTYVRTYENGLLVTSEPIIEYGDNYTIDGVNRELVSADAITNFEGTSGYEGEFTEKHGHDKLSVRLSNEEYKYMHFVYTRTVDDFDEAGVTVNHHYYTNYTYINEDGVRVVDEIVDEFSNLGSLQTTMEEVPLYGGMNFQTEGEYTVLRTDADGNPYTATYALDTVRSDNFSLVLEPNMDNEINLYYFIDNDVTTKAHVQEYHHYQTTTISLNSDGVPTPHLSGYITNDAQTKDSDIYVDQTYTATAKSSTLTKVETMVDGSVVALSPEGDVYSIVAIDGENVINFYYDTVVDYTQPAKLIVNHHYTTYYVDGTVGKINGTPDRLSSYASVTHGYSEKVNEFGGNFVVTGTESANESLNTADKTITLEAGRNVIDIYYERRIDNRPSTAVTVIYEYYLNDTTYEGRESKTYTGIRFIEGDPYSVEVDPVRHFAINDKSKSHAYDFKSGDNSITLVHDKNKNVITLIYNREVTPDEPDEPDVPTTPSKPKPPVILTKYYSLTVKWVDEDGHSLADKDYSPHLRTGTMYDTTKKSFEGYHFIGMQAGSDPASGVIRSDKYVTYVYAPDDVPEVPEIPDVPEIPEIPETDVPLTDIPDLEVPLEDIPTVDVPLVDVPLTDIPQTGDNRNLAFLASTALFSALGLVALVKSEMNDKKKRSEG